MITWKKADHVDDFRSPGLASVNGLGLAKNEVYHPRMWWLQSGILNKYIYTYISFCRSVHLVHCACHPCQHKLVCCFETLTPSHQALKFMSASICLRSSKNQVVLPNMSCFPGGLKETVWSHGKDNAPTPASEFSPNSSLHTCMGAQDILYSKGFDLGDDSLCNPRCLAVSPE